MEESRIGNLPADAECHERHRMGMHDRFQIGPGLIDGSMEWELGRGPMRSNNLPACLQANDVSARQAPFVDPRWSDPGVAVPGANRKIAAGGRRHAVTI